MVNVALLIGPKLRIIISSRIISKFHILWGVYYSANLHKNEQLLKLIRHCGYYSPMDSKLVVRWYWLLNPALESNRKRCAWIWNASSGMFQISVYDGMRIVIFPEPFPSTGNPFINLTPKPPPGIVSRMRTKLTKKMNQTESFCMETIPGRTEGSKRKYTQPRFACTKLCILTEKIDYQSSWWR